MTSGGCFCGNIKIKYNGESLMSGICHCLDCRKLSGSAYSFSFIAKRSQVDVSGTPKEIVKSADSGNVVNNYFCPECGTPLYGGAVDENGEIDALIIRSGVFEDQTLLSQCAPVVEMFTSQRLKWVAPVEGCLQFEGMLPSQ